MSSVLYVYEIEGMRRAKHLVLLRLSFDGHEIRERYSCGRLMKIGLG